MATWWSPDGPAREDDLPAYLSAPEQAAAPTPSLELARAGARRLAHALADAHTAIVTTPPRPSPPGPSPLLQPGDWLPPVRATPARSGVFIRMVELPGIRLAAMLDEWWAAAAVDGWSPVGRRLRLAQPAGDARGGWTVAGRVRRLTPWHWAPVVIELWPRYSRWTMITMTPQASVLTTRRYFRTGHSAIDRFTRALAETRAAMA